MAPFSLNSGFQIRAQFTHGVIPLAIPEAQHRAVYLTESRNFVGSLAAGETVTFAHTKAGRTRRLRILEMGVKVLTGPGAVTLQVVNAGTNEVTHSYTQNSSRTDSGQETAESGWEYTLPFLAGVEFRLVQTNLQAVGRVSAHVSFG